MELFNGYIMFTFLRNWWKESISFKRLQDSSAFRKQGPLQPAHAHLTYCLGSLWWFALPLWRDHVWRTHHRWLGQAPLQDLPGRIHQTWNAGGRILSGSRIPPPREHGLQWLSPGSSTVRILFVLFKLIFSSNSHIREQLGVEGSNWMHFLVGGSFVVSFHNIFEGPSLMMIWQFIMHSFSSFVNRRSISVSQIKAILVGNYTCLLKRDFQALWWWIWQCSLFSTLVLLVLTPLFMYHFSPAALWG